MGKRFSIFAGSTISLLGSFVGFVLIVASEKYSIPNTNAAPAIYTLMFINILANAIVWIYTCGRWLEKEGDYYRYKKERECFRQK